MRNWAHVPAATVATASTSPGLAFNRGDNVAGTIWLPGRTSPVSISELQPGDLGDLPGYPQTPAEAYAAIRPEGLTRLASMGFQNGKYEGWLMQGIPPDGRRRSSKARPIQLYSDFEVKLYFVAQSQPAHNRRKAPAR